MREYIWLPEAEIAPTMGSRAQVDRSLAVIEAVNTVSPILYYVHVDHLNRPAKMTNTAKAVVWDAVWQPFGGLHSVSGLASLNARFPGQWFQAETGLHYNWHRSYDPTLGRYTQPDPLGFVDGPSVYGYALGSPHQFVDATGKFSIVTGIIGGGIDLGIQLYQNDWRIECVDPVQVFFATAAGSVSYIPLFGLGGFLNNNSIIRMGRSWNEKQKTEFFSLRGRVIDNIYGKKRTHIDLFKF